MKTRLVASLVALPVIALTFAVASQSPVFAATCNVPSLTHPTIQSAVNDPTCDPITVAAGTYNEDVTILRSVTLQGAQAGVDARSRSGPESIITNANGPIQIEANNVTIDGFTLEGASLDPTTNPGAFGAGIWTNPGFSGTQGGHQIVNNIIQNNIAGIELDNTGVIAALVQHNLIRNNTLPGAGSGNGIETSFGLTNALIDSNTFSGDTSTSMLVDSAGDSITVSNNTLVGGTTEGIAWFDVLNSSISGNRSIGSTSSATVDLAGGDSQISITGNVLAGGVRGIQVADPFAVGPNSGVTAHNNCIEGNSAAGLEEDNDVSSGGGPGYAPPTAGSLDATSNWWGKTTGPTIASNPGGTGDRIIDQDGVVGYKPFLTQSPGGSCPAPVFGCTATSISSNFSGTPIASGDTIWFSSVLKATGLGTHPVTLTFSGQTITFTANHTPTTLAVPDAQVTFSPTATSATTTFTGGRWVTTVPSSGLAGNAFLSGLEYQPPGGLPGGVQPVLWSGTLTSDTPGVSINWQWAAAAYTTFSPDYNSLGVKPVDDTKASVYKNSDHAGTPEAFKPFVTGGATGGGGANYTGSLSGTGKSTCS